MKTVNFKLKRPDQEQTALLVDFNLNGQRIALYPGQQVMPKFWSEKAQIVSEKHPNANKVNEYLKKWKRSLEDILSQMKIEGEYVTKQAIQDKLNQVFNKAPEPVEQTGFSDDFLAYYDVLLERNKNTWSKPYQVILKQNRRHLMQALNLVEAGQLKIYRSLGDKKKGLFGLSAMRPLKFDQINKKTFETFAAYLYEQETTVVTDGIEEKQGYKLNYIGKHIKELKRVVRDAINDGLIKNITIDQVKNVKEPGEEVDNIYCDFEDIKGFIDLELDDQEEKDVRSIFVFNCFFGQRYGDIFELNKSKFTRTPNNRIVFVTRQAKTTKRVNFTLDKNAQHVLEEHNFQLPKITDVKFNKIIKRLAQRVPSMHRMFEVTETRGKTTSSNFYKKHQLISSHTMRRSFCTNFYKSQVSIQVIMAISGHTEEKTLRLYIKDTLDQEVIANEVDKVPFMFAMAS